MSVIIVGGNDRMATRYKYICKSYVCKANVFIIYPTGFVKKIGSLVLAVVFTDTVSHKMPMVLTKEQANLIFPWLYAIHQAVRL